jgi:hypothetical protein
LGTLKLSFPPERRQGRVRAGLCLSVTIAAVVLAAMFTIFTFQTMLVTGKGSWLGSSHGGGSSNSNNNDGDDDGSSDDDNDDDDKNAAPWYTQLAIPLLNALQIFVFAFLYQALAERLTEFENHLTVADHNGALFKKLFSFYFVNYYTTLFYIAFVKRHREGCYEPVCYNVTYRSVSVSVSCLLRPVSVLKG